MKDQLHSVAAQARNVAEAGMLVREYLQARILEVLQRTGAFQNWAFLGGTAIRFLFKLPRFSEDLDFSRVEFAPSRESVVQSASVRRHPNFGRSNARAA